LYRRSFASPDGDSLAPSDTPSIGGACELAVTAHEGGAWLRHVLANPAGPDIDRYLADVYTAAT
jgi:hypothetical protein